MGHSYSGSRSISLAQGGLSHSESNLSRRVLRDIFHPLTVFPSPRACHVLSSLSPNCLGQGALC